MLGVCVAVGGLFALWFWSWRLWCLCLVQDAGCCAIIVGVCVGCFWMFVVLVGLVGFMFGVLAYWLGCLGGFGWLFCLWW